MPTAAEFYSTLSPGRKAALHAEFQQRYAPNTTQSDYLLQPQLFQEFLQTPRALSILLGTGFQPGVTPNQAPAQTQTSAQYAQGRQLRDLAEARIGQQFSSQTLPLLALAQAMARIEPGRITTPQFNTRTGVNNFAEFAGQAPLPTVGAPTTGVSPQPGDSPFPSIASIAAGGSRDFGPRTNSLPTFNTGTQRDIGRTGGSYINNGRSSFTAPGVLNPRVQARMQGFTNFGGPSQQELVGAVQNGLRLGRPRKSAF